MEKLFKNSVFRTIVCITLLLFLFNGISISQEKKASTEKIFKEIAGSYEFNWQEDPTVIIFSVEDGKLVAAPEGQDLEVLEPVEGEELKFQVTLPNGNFFEMEFIRDEKGKITKCKLSGMGEEMEGKKIKDGKTLPA